MPEFWHKSEQRGRETVTFWRRFLPAMTVGLTSPDAHAADFARLGPLAQAVADARADVKIMKQRELAAFHRIRLFNLTVPQLIAGQFDDGHPLRTALARIYTVVPRSDKLNLRRARMLIPIWKKADAALAARTPGAAIVRDAVGVMEFEQLVADYPKAVQATADAVTAFRVARTALRTQHHQVDRLNKRAYLKFKAEARTDATLRAALAAAITREKTSGSRLRPGKRRKLSGRQAPEKTI